jgi:hypothetical protein
MPNLTPEFDVVSQPAMPPPPPRPAQESPLEPLGLAKSADPRHNPPRLSHGRGDQR